MSGSAGRWAAGIGLLALLVFTALWFTAREASDRNEAPAEHEEALAGTPAGAVLTDVSETAADAVREASSAVHALSLSGVIRSRDGAPVADALVRWIALRFEDVESNPVWRTLDWGWPERLSVETRSRADGSFELDNPPGADLRHGTVVHVLHPDHFARGVDLPNDGFPYKPLEIVLEPAHPIAVRVIDPRGQAILGARVRHIACMEQPASSEDFSRARPRRFLAEEVKADDGGRATLTRFSGEQVLWALTEVGVSLPWQGEDPPDIELVVGDSFDLDGTLSLPDWSDIDASYRGERRILVSGLSANLWRPLARLRDVQAGDWGPVRVPLKDLSRIRVRLEGSPIIPQELEFDAPVPGARRHIAFAAEKGLGLPFDVRDPADNPLPTACAEVWWEDPHTLGATNRVEFGANSQGRIETWGFPPGIVNYRLSAPGFARVEGSMEVPDPLGVLVTLEKVGLVRGHCLQGKTPVQDFEVIYRRHNSVQVYERKVFLNRADGSFEIDGLTHETWLFGAASPNTPSCAPVVVDVAAEGETAVELQLSPGARGVGRVIDGSTGDALPSARIQVFSGGLERTVPWGLPFPVEPDGTFDLDAFVLGRNFITVSAEGYASRRLDSTLMEADILDWGDIPLVHPQSLSLRLVGGPPSGSTLESLRIQGEATDPLVERHFDPSGRAVFEDVSPGPCKVGVLEASGRDWTRLDVELIAGTDWNYDFQLTGPRRLDVTVKREDGKELDDEPAVMITAKEPEGFVVRWRQTHDGSVTFEGIRAERVDLFVFDHKSNVVAKSEARLGDAEQSRVEVHIGGRALRIHVVDADGAPLAGASTLTRSRTGAHIFGLGNTDGDGWAALFGQPAETVLLDVQHGLAGQRFGVPIDASAGEIEFVLDAKGSLELALRDGADVLAQVATWIESSDGTALSQQRLSDSDGNVRYGPLGEGTYRIACRRGDCWPTFVERSLAADEKARCVVEMRRLADLELVVLDAHRIPVSGLAVALRSTEFEQSVEDWIEAGRVRAPSGLTTDVLGKLSIPGLPHGAYTWTVEFDGQQVTGSLDLRPSSEPLSVALP